MVVHQTEKVMSQEDFCLICKKPTKWLRFTQFAGTHPFCEEHAKAEEDFGKDGGSYYFWAEAKAAIVQR